MRDEIVGNGTFRPRRQEKEVRDGVGDHTSTLKWGPSTSLSGESLQAL